MTNLHDTTNNDVSDELTAPAENEEELIEDLGTLAFESALLQYMAEADEEALEKFEKYIDVNASNENFLEELCIAYPDFEKLLLVEIATIQNDIKEITTE